MVERAVLSPAPSEPRAAAASTAHLNSPQSPVWPTRQVKPNAFDTAHMYTRNRPTSPSDRAVRFGYRPKEWADKPLGEVLTTYREAYGKSVEEVAEELRIRRFHIKALEAEDYQDLPEQAYTAGFVRSYASYLGLPPEEMVGRFREAYVSTAREQRPRAPYAPAGATAAYSTRWPSFAVLLIAAVLLGSAYMVMSAYTRATNPGLQQDPQFEVISSQGIEDLAQTIGLNAGNEPVLPDATTAGSDELLFDYEGFDETPALSADTAQTSLSDDIATDTVPLEVQGEDTVVVFGINLPAERPAHLNAAPEAPQAADTAHRVVIRANGRAYLTVFNHETGEPFLRREYQRGDEYAVPDGQIVRLLSLDVSRIELLIDGKTYTVAPAIAELGNALVLDPDEIIESGQLVPVDESN